jgi:hypothetical protein
MFPAEFAKLFYLQPLSLLFLVPRGGIIAALALHALQGDDFSHARLF